MNAHPPFSLSKGQNKRKTVHSCQYQAAENRVLPQKGFSECGSTLFHISTSFLSSGTFRHPLSMLSCCGIRFHTFHGPFGSEHKSAFCAGTGKIQDIAEGRTQ
jgi:hypothetical protein